MSIEAMKLALEALEFNVGEIGFTEVEKKALIALRQAIEQAQKQDHFRDATKLMAQKQEPVSWESILGAVARGWCYEENANKTIDSELAVAIAKEVQALYR